MKRAMTRSRNLKVLLGFAAVYLIWGSTYLAIRVGVETIPPFLMTGFRFVAGGLLLYGWSRMRGSSAPRLSHWWPAIILGLLMPAGGTGLVSWAEKTVPSGLTALLVAVTPMWIVLGDWVSPGGRRPTLPVIFGLALGFCGVVMLINPTEIGGSAEIDRLGAFAIVLATMSWAAGSIFSRHADQPDSKVLAAGMQMITGGVGLILASGLAGEWSGLALHEVTIQSWIALTYLAVIGSLAFVAYIWILSASTPAKASTYAFVNPVIAIMLGSMVVDEPLTAWTLGCAATVIVAVAIIIMFKNAPDSISSDKALTTGRPTRPAESCC
jgi:drug/metabolite transporter (DMT)-like permease